MSQVTIQINGRPYTVGCEDGQEAHLTQLASVFDKQVQQVAASVGPLAETRLFLLAALMMADELTDTRNRMTKLREQAEKLAADRTQTEMRSVRALEAVARRIEALSAKAEAKA